MPKVLTPSVGIGLNQNGEPSVVFMIPAESLITTHDGTQEHGIAMSPGQAREFAYVFLLHAEQIVNASVPLPSLPEIKTGGDTQTTH